MDFNFNEDGNFTQRIQAQINKIAIGEYVVIDKFGRTPYEVNPTVRRIGLKLNRRFSIKTSKATGEITVARVSLVNPPINYSEFIRQQIESMSVGASKVLKTKNKQAYECSQYVTSYGRRIGRKYKLKTDKATGKIWVGRLSWAIQNTLKTK